MLRRFRFRFHFATLRFSSFFDIAFLQLAYIGHCRRAAAAMPLLRYALLPPLGALLTLPLIAAATADAIAAAAAFAAFAIDTPLRYYFDYFADACGAAIRALLRHY